MRLGQLARKLDLETSDIIKYLKKENIEVENHLNTKLEDETVAMVLKAFTPIEKPKPVIVKKEEKTPEPTIIVEEVVLETEVEEITPEPVQLEEIKPVEVSRENEALTVAELREKEAAEIENQQPETREIIELSREDKVPENSDVAVIRAPKIELQGIKVLGKIELPEKPQKEVKENLSNDLTENNTDSSPTETTENETVVKGGKHPNKKKIKTKAIIVPDSEIRKEEEAPLKPKKAKEIKAEKKAKEKGVKKKKPAHKQEEVSERQKVREKRKKQREKQKDAPKKSQKSWLRQLWDAIK